MEIPEILRTINSPEIQAKLLPLKIIFGGIGLFFFGMIIFLSIRATWTMFMWFDVREFFTFRAFGLRKATGRWHKIMARLATADEAEYKLAIMEADNIVDEVLRKMNIAGENLTERLQKVSPAVLTNLQDVVKAHGVRDNIVHDPDYRLTLQEARNILAIYEATFQSWDII
jgi:hypothetical protein